MPDYGKVINDALSTSTVNSGGIPIDMESMTKVLNPESYTALTIVSKFGKTIQAKDMLHKYRERRPIPNWTTIAVADAAASSSIEVTDPTYINNDVILWIVRPSTGQIIEQLLVQDTSIDATVDVVEWHDSTGTGGIQNATVVGDIVVIGPESHSEGEAVPTAYSNTSVNQQDRLMQSDRAVKKTDIEGYIAHYDDQEKQLVADLKMAWVEEKQKHNMNWYMGFVTSETTTGTNPRINIKGIFRRLTENVQDYSGVGAGWTRQSLQETIRITRDNTPGGGKKVLIAGSNINNAVSAWPETQIRTSPAAKLWGIMVNVIRTQYGDVVMTYDNALTARYGLADRGVLLDTTYIRRMVLKGDPMRAILNITTQRDIHNMEHVITGTEGIQMSAIETMAQIIGVD